MYKFSYLMCVFSIFGAGYTAGIMHVYDKWEAVALSIVSAAFMAYTAYYQARK